MLHKRFLFQLTRKTLDVLVCVSLVISTISPALAGAHNDRPNPEVYPIPRGDLRLPDNTANSSTILLARQSVTVVDDETVSSSGSEMRDEFSASLPSDSLNFAFVRQDSLTPSALNISTKNENQQDALHQNLPVKGNNKFPQSGREIDLSIAGTPFPKVLPSTEIPSSQSAIPLSYGDIVTGTISAPRQVLTYTFTASVGDLVSAAMNSTIYQPELRLFAPDDSLLKVGTNYYYTEITQTLSVAGTHRLVVGSNGGIYTGTFTLAIDKLNSGVQSIAYGQIVTSTISPMGDQDEYVFNGTAGHRVTAYLNNQTSFWFSLRLTKPDGSFWICGPQNGDCQYDNQTLPSTGVYTLTVDANTEGTGLYSISLNRLDGDAQPITFNQSISSTISPLGDQDTFVFNGSAGQRITVYLANQASYQDAFSLRLTKPDNASWLCDFAYGDCQIDNVTLPVTGVYTLTVDGNNASSGAYTLSLRWNNDPIKTQFISYGQVVTGTIAMVAETDAYSFAASAGDIILIRASTTGSYLDPEIRLYDPNGNLRVSNYTNSSFGYALVETTVVITSTGSYTLQFGDYGRNEFGNYGLYAQRLNGPGNPMTIYSGQAITSTISTLSEMDAFTFVANADEPLSIVAQESPGGSSLAPEIRLFSPQGDLIASKWDYNRVEITNTRTTMAGAYTLLIGDHIGINTGSYTLNVTLFGATPLVLGQSYTNQIHNHEILFYAIPVVTPGQGLLIEVTPLTGTNQLWVQERFGELPFAGQYDLQTQNRTPRGTFELQIEPTRAGTYYVSIFGADVASPQGSFRISARTITRYLSDVNPRSGGNSGTITLNLSGLGFASGMRFELRSTGKPTIASDAVTILSPTTAWAHFALSGAAPGIYNVHAIWQGGAEQNLSNAFTINAGIGPRLDATLLISPETVRRGTQIIMWVEYGNMGDVDMPAPVFVITGTARVPMSLAPNGPQSTDSIQALGYSFDQPAGTLRPGSRYRIPVYATIFDSTTFSLSTVVADTTLIDWNAIEPQVRPSDIAPALWTAIWTNFKTSIGNTWQDYERRLDDQASYLAQYGNSPFDRSSTTLLASGYRNYDIAELLSTYMSRAAGAYPQRTLASSLDAYSPARDLALAFARVAFNILHQRFTVGSFGRTWSHSFEYKLTQPDDTHITIKGPGGTSRTFTKDVWGNWKTPAGDFSKLEQNVGVYRIREVDGLVWQFDASGNLVFIEEPNGNRITLGYTSGRLTSISHSNGQGFTLGYNPQGRVSTLTDHAGQVTQYLYDASGERLVTVIAPGNVTTSYTYTPVTGATADDNALESITFPDNTHQYFAYESQGRLTAQWRDGNAERVEFTYDGLGSVSIKDASNAVTAVRLGTRGELLQIQDPLGNRARFQYDTNFNLIGMIAPDGSTSSLSYDNLGNVTQAQDPLGQLVSLGYTTQPSRLDWLRDALGNLTDFATDSRGNPTTMTYPDGSTESFGYDSVGNLTSATNRRNQTISFIYNAQGQVTRKSYPDGRTINYSYNARGNLTSAADSLTGTIAMQYDSRGFLTRIDYPGGRWFTFEYNNVGARTRRTGHDGYVLNYQYDALGRLLRLTDGTNAEIVRYEYDSVGRLNRENKGNGTYTTYVYDSAGRLTSMVNYAPNSAVQSRFDYTYDANGNRKTMTTIAGTTSYDYDATGQLVGVTYPGGRRVTYSYDAAGNRITVSDNGALTNYTTNDLNQYIQVGSTTYAYDADGNMTSKIDATGTTTYTYDIENRLIGVTTPISDTWQYTYDALGNRVSVTHDGATTRYVHDPIGLVDVASEYDGSGTLVARYVHGFGLTARVDAGGNRAYYAFDGTGHTRQLTNPAGTVANTYDYDPFGILLQSSETFPNAFQYVGRFGVMEEGGGLQFMRMRLYDPRIGRFLSVDPMGYIGATNLYLQVSNNPIVFIDPSGMHSWTIPIPPTTRPLTGIGPFDCAGCAIGTRDPKDPRDPWTTPAGDPFIDNPMDPSGNTTTEKPDPINIPRPSRDRNRIPQGVTVPWKSKYDYWWDFDPAYRWPPPTLPVPLPPMPAPTEPRGSGDVSGVNAVDPNEKVGPLGTGAQRSVKGSDDLGYIVYFENLALATAPAQEVVVVDQLDPDLDWLTFRPTEIAFGNIIIAGASLPGGFSAQVSIPDFRTDVHKTWQVDITADINYQTGKVKWTFRTLDPLTGQLPVDALAGFLPPNDSTHGGEGHVAFSIRPRSNLANGTLLSNQAAITFDTEATINTNVVTNTIGTDGSTTFIPFAGKNVQAVQSAHPVTTTGTITPTLTITATATLTHTLTPTITPTLTATVAPTLKATTTLTATVTRTPTIVKTPTASATATLTPTVALTPTPTPKIIMTSTPTKSATATSTPTTKATPTLTRTFTPTPTLKPAPTATSTLTPSPTKGAVGALWRFQTFRHVVNWVDISKRWKGVPYAEVVH